MEIKWSRGKTQRIKVAQGLKQGCPLSPLLFNLYIARLPAMINKATTGVILNGKKLTNLLYADDIVLLAESHQDLIKSIHILSKELSKLNLTTSSAA